MHDPLSPDYYYERVTVMEDPSGRLSVSHIRVRRGKMHTVSAICLAFVPSLQKSLLPKYLVIQMLRRIVTTRHSATK